MELVKIVVVGISCALIIIYLKNVNSELAAIATVASGVLVLLLTISYVTDFISLISSIGETAVIGGQVVKIVVKILGIAYLVEFSTDLIDDLGLKSLSDKVTLAGKILIITAAYPIIENLVKLVVNLI